MTVRDLALRFATPRRAPLLAAIIALLASLPGLFTLPPTDRDESRFAEASAQMLETGDLTNIMLQQTPRYKKPVGVYWLQATSVKLLSQVEARQIWAYRVPSVLGAMLAAAACAWGALAFLKPTEAAMAGGLLAATMALSTEEVLATTDAALCGAITLSMAAMARVYLAEREGPPVGRWVKLLFWLGMAASVLLKGPIGPMVVGLTLLTIGVWERRWRWMARLRWDWGMILIAGAVLPWAFAITVVSDGGFWGSALGGDLAPKLAGGQEGHGAPPGYYLLLSPVLLFPASLLLPAGLTHGWQKRLEPGIRFALCWLVPTWLLFELVPTKLPHYTLPTFGALAWLMAAALREPLEPRVRWIGAGLLAVVAVALAVAAAVAAALYGGGWSWPFVALAALLLLGSAGAGALLLLRKQAGRAAIAACILGVLGHGALVGCVAPTLGKLWLSQEVAQGLSQAGLGPGQPNAQGPVAVAGYQEPSLVFALGAPTVLGTPKDAADAIAQGRAAVVEGRQDAAFQQALAADHAAASVAGVVQGLDYSSGHAQVLRLYRPAAVNSGP
ncbi:MAG TPA: glycosyltransferase family 39 protein [Caulobacteraceae bacterium]|nr:glycosyltransferase family 39 protein [Caulobacteraceae bacterium]